MLHKPLLSIISYGTYGSVFVLAPRVPEPFQTLAFICEEKNDPVKAHQVILVKVSFATSLNLQFMVVMFCILVQVDCSSFGVS